VLGTSLAVAPFNGLVAKPRGGVPRVYINRTKPGAMGWVGWMLGLGRSVNFKDSTDLILLGDCDDQAEKICAKVGWSEALAAVPVQTMEP